jgi:hypothetical protein
LTVLPDLIPTPGSIVPSPSAADRESALPAPAPVFDPVGVTDEQPTRSSDEKAEPLPAPNRAQSTTELARDEGSQPAVAPPKGPPDLRIAELRLCRKVFGFGSFEPIGSSTVSIGQPFLLYCEMTGLHYEPKGDTFVSRLSARLALKATTKGSIVWEQTLDTAEDLCRRPRRDYFVNYRIELPRSLEPGTYQFRLIQTDLFADRSTTAEVPLTIVP